MTIPKKSSWPFHPLLVQLANSIEQAPAPMRQPAVMKTVERCFRLGVKLAVHFGMPGQLVIQSALEQCLKEGGDDFKHAFAGLHDSIVEKALTEFKASEQFQDHVAVKQLTAGVTAKGSNDNN